MSIRAAFSIFLATWLACVLAFFILELVKTARPHVTRFLQGVLSRDCPNCGRSPQRALYMGAPLRMCFACNEEGPMIWGLGAYVPLYLPVSDGFFFSFFFYSGGYWRALWKWLRGAECEHDE